MSNESVTPQGAQPENTQQDTPDPHPITAERWNEHFTWHKGDVDILTKAEAEQALGKPLTRTKPLA